MKPKIIQLLTEDHDNFIHIIADYDSGEAAVVDPAWDAEGIMEVIEEEGLTLTAILLTHVHHDHVNAVKALYGSRVTLFAGEHEYHYWPECPEDAVLVADGDEIQFGKTSISVIHTPGHTAGGICYLIDKHLLTGDTLFIYGCGRADLKGGDVHQLYRSLQRLKQLPPDTNIWVGHNYSVKEESTIGEQLETNPFLLIDNEEDFVRYRGGIAAKTRKTPYTPMTRTELQTVLEQYS